MTQGEETAYACCSAGIGRWCWFVWASEEEAKDLASPVSRGYEKNADAAERKAVEAAGEGAKRLPTKWASGYLRHGGRSGGGEEAAPRVKPKSRLSRRPDTNAPARPKAPARLAFLYAASESDQPGSRGEVEVVRHRIVRQTAGKFYVDREPFREEEWTGQEPDAPKPRTLAVDRETLRREGRFPHRGSNFYISEDAGIREVHATLTARHPWCATLGVRFPCSPQSIKAAYRRLAREAHPDAGGDPAEFRAVERAYREALAYFASPDDTAKPGT
ncbi:DnaJ domain-containing protein [Paludisphaera rhizosphaerae]|uniref:DnaJ domain-containing protein n=1 Tax=Paludisphaera rhizosphaerae TaxID=2711216 RepID=UPI0013ED8189|nr:DnaJ domain-containing protein [Paludisphaera rhizosphaerae]